jgi:hypothetical protein
MQQCHTQVTKGQYQISRVDPAREPTGPPQEHREARRKRTEYIPQENRIPSAREPEGSPQENREALRKMQSHGPDGSSRASMVEVSASSHHQDREPPIPAQCAPSRPRFPLPFGHTLVWIIGKLVRI